MQSILDRMRLIVFNQINTLKSMRAGLQDSVRKVPIGHDVLRNEIGSKIYLTIFAESKGPLTWGERFFFEMVGDSVGRCVNPCAFFGKSVKHIFSYNKMYSE